MENINEWRKICLNFTDDVKWLVSEIAIAPHRNAGMVQKQDENRFTVKALWDTGSTTTIICPEIAQALNLKDLGKEKLMTLVGKGEVSTYRVDLFLPDDIIFQKVKVVELACRNAHFDMVIGLDIIKLGNFQITKKEQGFDMQFNLPITTKVKAQ